MMLDKFGQITRVINQLLALVMDYIRGNVVQESRVMAHNQTCDIILRLEPVFQPSHGATIQLCSLSAKFE